MSRFYDGYMCRENKNVYRYTSAIKKYIGQHTDVIYRQDFTDLVKEANLHKVYISAVVVEDKIIDFYFVEDKYE